MKISKFLIVLIAVCAVFTLQAQTANLSIQGILRTAEGTAVEDDNYELTFKLYNQPNTGNPLWYEVIEDVAVKGGIYSVVLGNNIAEYPLNIPFDEVYYLGVTVEGGIELNPRARLTSSPYALSLIGDDNIFPNSGNVGVGAANPTHKLTVKRGDGVLGLEADETAGNTAVITTTADGMTLDAGGADKIYSFNNGRIAATADEQFTVEGTDTAQIILSNSNGSATLGFDATNGDDLQLSNSIGATKIEANQIVLNPTNGPVEINKNGEALKLIGTDSGFISFYPNGEPAGMQASFGFSAGDDISLVNETTGDINLETAGNINLESTGSGDVIFHTPLRLKAAKNHYFNDYFRVTPENASRNTGSYTIPMALFSESGIRASIFVADSDKRIKKDFRLSNANVDLTTLNKIEVTDYRHIDLVKEGNDYRKGLIAQQVKSVFPEAITTSSDYIPSIYETASNVKQENGTYMITLPNHHGLDKSDRVQIITEEGKQKTKVKDIVDEFTFSIQPEDFTIGKDVFVYGKEVDDFHSIDYDRIFTLNVSATQELARQVEALKKENAELKDIVSDERHVNENLKAEVKDMNARLQNIESMFNTTGAQK